MSYSFYRGKLYTNEEIKGPYTEAGDNFQKDGFSQIAAEIPPEGLDNIMGMVVKCTSGGVIVFKVNGVVITISEDGTFEISEGAA